ncbi:MAG: hypothetical protein QHH10_04080 [Peptococcaceae bacterium]|jgi:hypothetical protein|nr:hypothetical protein [Peptococcaceae bacterium]MDH7524473.1 hypothetical protein [Peptococcaceae bacterium]
MMQNTIKKWNIVTGILTIAVGLPYVLGLYGPTEAEVRTWGNMAIILGVGILFSSTNVFITKRVLGSLLLITTLIQIPPIVLWFVFHGYGISDGTPPSSFMAHWGFSFPHIFVVLAAGWCLFLLYKPAKSE